MVDYRHGALRCPGCRETLQERAAEEVHVDVCPACGGIWVDWMDGDLRTVSERLAALPPGRDVDELAAGCPVCRQALDPGELLGAIIHRCGSCAGTFLPRSSLTPLAGAAPVREKDPLLTRLLEALGRWLTLG